MGYMKHNAIVVTGLTDYLMPAHRKACELFHEPWDEGDKASIVSPVVHACTNGYASFFVSPDGSKEGWETSNIGDERRDAFVKWLREADRCDWVEVQFGDDNYVTRIVRDSDDERR